LACNGEGIMVGCAKDSLFLMEVQAAGKKRMAAGDYLCGCCMAPGERLDT